MRRSCLLLLLVASASGGEAYLGAKACGTCHPAQYKQQTRSHHAAALRPMVESRLAAILGDTRPGWLTWTFGAGAQGMTPVGIHEGRYFEYRFSYYAAPQRLDLTFGHPTLALSAEAQLGVAQDNRAILQCFQCHATGARPGPQGPDLTAMQPGVSCERCHGPGERHVAAATAQKPAAEVLAAVVRPRLLAVKAQVEACGACHRLPEPGDANPEPELEDPVSVRFAPMGLMASRCFTASSKLACVTCHDPHEDARPRGDASYTAACQGCHAERVAAISKCPRAAGGTCVSCHMKQASLGPYLRFTDHRIRIY